MASSVKTIDEYISAYDGELKERMITLRAHPQRSSGYCGEDRLGDSHLCSEGESDPLLCRKEAHGLPSGAGSNRCLR